MSAHTPGPWVVFKLRLSGMFVIGKPIDERTDTQGDGLAMADTEADARLIAAAPDLLAALRDLLGDRRNDETGHCVHCGRDNRGHEHEPCLYEPELTIAQNIEDGACPGEIARAVIAKATGDESDCPGHIASDADPKVCGRCGTHIDSLRPEVRSA